MVISRNINHRMPKFRNNPVDFHKNLGLHSCNTWITSVAYFFARLVTEVTEEREKE